MTNIALRVAALIVCLLAPAFAPAVAIAANTTYIASYHSDGYFAIDTGFFAAAGADAPPLHAPRAGAAGGGETGGGPNGVFAYGASAFPASGGSNNYWVDVVLA